MKQKYKDAYEREAARLTAQLTLEEKVGLLFYVSSAVPRLGIPEYNWWNEALHGVARAGTATVFPQAIGLAATFDADLLHTVGDAVSTEARAKFNAQRAAGDCDIYKGLTLWAPNVNIFRDPRWGRGHETFGEDPYLTAELATAYIRGLQGDDERYLKAAACAKHFAVHSGPENLRHSFDACVGEPELSETYLYAFRACVEAGVEGVMAAYNSVNGTPCCANSHLLNEVLRKNWGFDGYVTSDCWSVADLYKTYCVAKTPQEAAALAVKNGCDVNCGCTYPYLTDALQQGLITEAELDVSVKRALATRLRLGILQPSQHTPYDGIGYDRVDSPAMRALNLQVARKSLVLLKNANGLLPLDKKKIKTVGVIGPNADSRGALVGNYEGTASRYETVLEGLQDYLGDDVRVCYSVGCHLFRDRFHDAAKPNDRLSEVKAVCAESDVVVACFGLDACIEGEEGDPSNQFGGGDKADLRLPGIQHDVLQTICDAGKPVIVVLLAGSSIDLTYESEHADAIVQAWYPGACGGRAVAELLFGAYAPEGKLPVTFYRSTDDLPPFTDYSMRGRTYRYLETEPLYPFGYGLTYGAPAVTQATCLTDRITEADTKLRVTVKNTGAYDVVDTVQVYVQADSSPVPHPQLKKVVKVALGKGEEKTVEVVLPVSAFALYGKDGVRAVVKGGYSVYVGNCQPDARSAALTGTRPIMLRFTAEKRIQLDVGR